MAAKKQAAKKPAAKKHAAKKQAAARSTAKQPATKKSVAKKSVATQPAAKRPASKQPAKAPAKTQVAKAPAKPQVAKAPAAKKSSKQPATRAPKPAATRPAGATAAAKPASTTSSATDDRSTNAHELPKPRFNKDGFGYTKDFDLSFVKEMYDLLQEERVLLTGQAKRLEAEAHQLVEEAEMGDVQFDDEGGEGDTMVVERERDLALSAQARETVADIDAAIDRIRKGTYGYSTVSGRPIPRERLEAIPWSNELVEEKVGGIGRR